MAEGWLHGAGRSAIGVFVSRRTIRVMSKREVQVVWVDAAVDRYRPRVIDVGQWLQIKEDVRSLLLDAEPPSEKVVCSWLSWLMKFLADQPGGPRSGSLARLTRANVDEYVIRCQERQAHERSLANECSGLRRLARAHQGEKARARRPSQRLVPFSPHSDAEMKAVRAVDLESRQQRALDIGLALSEHFGVRRTLLNSARIEAGALWAGERLVAQDAVVEHLVAYAVDGSLRVAKTDWESARAAVAEATGVHLRHQGLRHRFLARVMIDHEASASRLVSEFGLSTDDLDLMTPLLTMIDGPLDVERLIA